MYTRLRSAGTLLVCNATNNESFNMKCKRKILRIGWYDHNRVISNWTGRTQISISNYLLLTINTFKKHLSSELKSEAVKFKVSQL